jgi:Uma2 family endonuclease
MSASARKLPVSITVEQFLDWDGDGIKYDLVEGVLRAHAAPSDIHGTMHARVGALLTQHLDANHPRCRVVSGGGVQPKFRADWNFRIPDLTVTCTKNLRGEHAVPEPKVIIELLSPSNASDTWDNVRNYMTVPSIEQIVVIHTTHVFAEILSRDASGAWPDNTTELKAGAVIRLASIGLDIPLIATYRGTYLEA